MKDFWCSALDMNNLQPFEILILAQACEAYDRAAQARRTLKKEGLIFLDRFEKPKARPEVAVELNCKALFAKLLKQVRLYNEHWAYFDE